MGELQEQIAQHGQDAVAALKKIAAAKGRLQGNFYFACNGAASTAGLVVTLTARDSKGSKATAAGKKLRKAIPGAKFARGTVTSDGKRLVLTLYTGNATISHVKKSIKSAFEDKAMAALKRLLRTAKLANPAGEESGPEESAEPELGLSPSERKELEKLIEKQGPLVEQSAELMGSFLSVHEEAAEREEIVGTLTEEIKAMEAAGLEGLDALQEKRRQLAEALSIGDLPTDTALSQELRQLMSMSTEKMNASITMFHGAAWERVCKGYAAALEAVTGQLETLRGTLRAESDPDLQLIAAGGLAGLLAPHQGRLDAALQAADVDQTPKTLGEIKAAAGLLAARLDEPHAVAVADNPFAVVVDLRTRLQPAARQLADAADVLAGAS